MPTAPVTPLAQAADTLLVVDVGNTRVGAAVWDADGLHPAQRGELESGTAWRDALTLSWTQARGAARPAVVIASVNPRGESRVNAALAELTGLTPLRIREDIPLPLPLRLENEREVGVDRVCSAAAAFERVQGACAVATFGTAITIDLVSTDGAFMGGAILPGLELSCRALHEHTAQLPHIVPAEPSVVVGRNTHDAIMSGVVYGAAGALREIVERFATDLGRWPPLIATGGNAALIARIADFVDAVVPDLCLMGVALAYRKSRGQT